MRCRRRVSKLLLRHGRVYDRKAWTQAHARWLAAQSFEQPNTRSSMSGIGPPITANTREMPGVPSSPGWRSIAVSTACGQR
jgi:hypothetical protein